MMMVLPDKSTVEVVLPSYKEVLNFKRTLDKSINNVYRSFKLKKFIEKNQQYGCVLQSFAGTVLRV